jgi:hypothetical protein
MLDIWNWELPKEFPYRYEPMGRVLLKIGEEVNIFAHSKGGEHMFAWVISKEKGIGDGVWWYWLTDKQIQPTLF